MERIIALNRKARHDYFIEETYEAGLALTGSEIKSIRTGRANLKDSYVNIKNGEAWLIGVHISPYRSSGRWGHEPKRDRKLLLHRSEIHRLIGAVQAKGYTIVPLRLYLKGRHAKVEIGLARGKKLYDKRRAIARREAQIEMERALRRQEEEL